MQHTQAGVARPAMVWCRWFSLLQQNTSPVPLVSLNHVNKHELPLVRPPTDFGTPVLVVVGDKDLVVDLEAAQETAEHFGQHDVVQLPGIAHDLMLVRLRPGSYCCLCNISAEYAS